MATLGDGFKGIFLAGIGAVAIGAEKGKELVDQLVARGEMTVEQGKQINTELKHRASNLESSIRRDTIEARMSMMSPDERVEFANIVREMADTANAKDAEAAAEAKGGHLVVIDSAEKWTRVAQLADESGLTYVWIGLYRADSGELAWVKDNIDPVYNWAAGEPSVRDTNGAAENYVLIARRSDGWYYNDCIGDPAAKYPQFYGGKTGYIIEIDP